MIIMFSNMFYNIFVIHITFYENIYITSLNK